MKRAIILLGFFLAITTNISAQRLKANAIVKAKHSSFKIEMNKYGSMSIDNYKNVLKKERPQNQNFDTDSEGFSGVAAAFKQVFGDSRLKELLPERKILISYYVAPNGKPLEITFTLKPGTIITAAELEALETSLKKNVSFKLKWRGNGKQEANFVLISQFVSYNTILDGTLK